jgi:hypothetical protein
MSVTSTWSIIPTTIPQTALSSLVSVIFACVMLATLAPTNISHNFKLCYRFYFLIINAIITKIN